MAENRSVLVVLGHPDRSPERFCHALADAYAEGAAAAKHRVERIHIADYDVTCIASRAEWEDVIRPAFVESVQRAFLEADHIVFIHPLWLGTMPAALKAFMEHVLRPDFAFGISAGIGQQQGRLNGKSARVVVTMGMPALVFRLFYLSHGLSVTRRNILGFSGFRPVRTTIIGTVEGMKDRQRHRWLSRMRSLGARAR